MEASLFYFRFIIFAVSIWSFFNNNKDLIKYFKISLFLLIFFVIVDSYFQYFFGFNTFGFEYDSEINTRLSGIFNDELILGSFLVRILPIFLSLFLIKKNDYKFNFLIFLIFCLSAFLIFLSGERSAFFMFLYIVVLLFILIKEFFKIGLISLIALSVFIISQFFIDTEKYTKRKFNKTLTEINFFSADQYIFSLQHQNLYSTSFKIFYDNYLFGIGPKMFRIICKKKKYQTLSAFDHSINGCNTHPHNTYIQLLTETGILGFLPVFILFIITIRQLSLFFIKRYFLNQVLFKSNSKIILLIGLSCYLFPIMPTGNFFNSWISLFYSLLLGILMANLRKLKLD